MLGEDGEVAGEIVRLQNKNLGRLIPPQGNWDMNPCVDCGEPFSCCDYPVPPYPIFGFGGEYIGEKTTIRLCRFCEQIRKRERQAIWLKKLEFFHTLCDYRVDPYEW